MPIENDEQIETPEVEDESSLREDLEAVFAEQSREPDPAPAEAPEPARAEEQEPAASREDGRDDKGRFAKKAAPAGAAVPAAQEPPAGAVPTPPAGAPAVEPPKPAVVAPVPEQRAPQSWKPLEREAWAQVPAAAREAVLRREHEVQRVLQESAQARRSHGEFQEAIRPFEAMIRAEAGDPVKAIGGLLQTAYTLRTAAPAQKAAVMAQLIQGYGVDIGQLDAALSGQPAPAHAAPPPYDPRVDQLMQRLEHAEQARRTTMVESQRAVLEDFAASHEFYEDLREDIADILELASKRGQKVTLASAYERAVSLRPDVQQIVKQREAATAAVSAQAQTQRAKAASASVRSAPAVAPRTPNENTSLREDLEAAYRELSGR